MAEKLTDDQLRKALIELGEVNIGAVTATTRPIFLKKLNHLRVRQKQASNARTSKSTTKKTLGTFSSDESENEQDKKQPATSRRRLSGRSTAAATKRQTNQGVLQARKQEDDALPSTSAVDTSLSRRSLRNRTTTGTTATSNRRLSSDRPSRSDPPVGDNSYSHPRSKALISINNFSNDSLNRSKATDSVSLQVSLADDTQDSEADFDIDNIPDNFDSSDSDLDVYKVPDFASSRASSFSDRSTGTSLLPDGSFPSPTSSSDRRGTIPSSSFYGSRNTSQNASNSIRRHQSLAGRTNSASCVNDRAPLNSSSSHPFKMEDETKSFGNSVAHLISRFLVVSFFCFFVLIGVMYFMRTSSSDSQVKEIESQWKECKGNLYKDCYSTTQVNKAKSLITDLGSMLDRRAGDAQCGIADTRNMTLHEIEEGLQLSHFEKADLNILISLILENPAWKIDLLTEDGLLTDAPDLVHAMESSSPDISVWCRVSRAVSKVFFMILVLFSVLLLGYVGTRLLRWYWRRQDEESKRVYALVEKIIDVLKEYADDCQDNADMQPYLAIPHVRDMLIPPKERRKQQVLWDKAVRFLSANESRVRVELKTIHGEEFTVWRWLQACPNGSKVWQGQAFGEQESGGSRYCLSSCLKVRQMFDLDSEFGNDWHIYIQDALLEKCGPKHNILHIAVDKTSKEGCVYIKCKDEASAGRCYKSLHGWWFDGNLVTVKYLRLERYHDRFPDSVSCTKPMEASNNERLSLSQPFHQSIIEAI